MLECEGDNAAFKSCAEVYLGSDRGYPRCVCVEGGGRGGRSVLEALLCDSAASESQNGQG